MNIYMNFEIKMDIQRKQSNLVIKPLELNVYAHTLKALTDYFKKP